MCGIEMVFYEIGYTGLGPKTFKGLSRIPFTALAPRLNRVLRESQGGIKHLLGLDKRWSLA